MSPHILIGFRSENLSNKKLCLQCHHCTAQKAYGWSDADIYVPAWKCINCSSFHNFNYTAEVYKCYYYRGVGIWRETSLNICVYTFYSKTAYTIAG